METRDMTMQDVEERSAELANMMTSESVDMEAVEKEVEALETRKAEILANVENRKADLAEVSHSAKVVETIEKEEVRKSMTEKEIRNSKEYIDAYAEGLKSGDFRQCRTLMTENTDGGTVAVPDFVDEIIHTAWENNELLSLIRKVYGVKGNFKVNYEISGDDAVVHLEGGSAIQPENLTLGIVNISQISIKKVLPVTDEVYQLRGEAFIRYVYDELAYRIVKKVEDTLLETIMGTGSNTPFTSFLSAGSSAIADLITATGELSSRAKDLTVVLSRAKWAAIKNEALKLNYAVDPFAGMRVVFNETLKGAIVLGDFSIGALATFPGESEEVQYKFDDLTRKNEDVIEVFGRMMLGAGLVGPRAFAVIKAASDN